jgi:DNA-binding CsgD family transcriptional regulator
MLELTSQDFQLLSRCIAQLYLPCLLVDFPDRALSLIKQLVGSDAALCQSFNTESVTVVSTDLFSVDRSVVPPKIQLQYLLQDPLLTNLIVNNRWNAYKISDFTTAKELRSNEMLYEILYAGSYTNIDDAMTFSIHDSLQQPNLAQLPFSKNYSNTLKEVFVDGRFLRIQETYDNLCFVLGRTERSFREREREILNLFRPHLITAYHNVIHYTQLQQQLAQLAQVTEQFGTILLSADTYILYMSDRAAKILKFYFADEYIAGRQLPGILSSWVKQQVKEFNTVKPLQPLKPWKIQSSEKQLSIRLLKDALLDQWILTLDESEIVGLSIHSFRSIGLTKRESEVMFWVVQGLSNAEIAVQLVCSDGTIRKHLENIYTKLNVQSRSMAVAVALNQHLRKI